MCTLYPVDLGWGRSSAGEHIGEVKGLIELGDISSLVGMGKIEWKKFLETKKEGAEINKIRRYSRLVLRLGFPLTY